MGARLFKGKLSWVKETKQPHTKFWTDLGGIYTDIPPVATPMDAASPVTRAVAAAKMKY